MGNEYWKDCDVFDDLCEMIMKNRLVCLTGAGISKGLKLENGEEAQDWRGLLESIEKKIEGDLDEEKKRDISSLLTKDSSGEKLIEAATILRNANEVKFDESLLEAVRIKKDTYSNVHEKLLRLQPNGIITYNYDEAHENSIKMLKENNEWIFFTPYEEEKIKEIFVNRFSKKFLLKAHGTLGNKEGMVLTRDSYRNLFTKSPAYKAFLQNIFTNFQLLIVGFGFSDPDFELLIKEVFGIYGSPIQKHIVIKHEKDKSSDDTLYRLRYGMNYLYVKDFGDIPMILQSCITYGGKYINDMIGRCLSKKLEERSKVHREIRALSVVGKKCLTIEFEKRMNELIERETDASYNQSTELSELVYSYGLLLDVDEKYKQFLMSNIIERSIDSEPIAHALVAITSHLTIDDLFRVEEWINKFKAKPFREDKYNPDPHNRVIIYCEYLRVYVEAKYADHN